MMDWGRRQLSYFVSHLNWLLQSDEHGEAADVALSIQIWFWHSARKYISEILEFASTIVSFIFFTLGKVHPLNMI